MTPLKRPVSRPAVDGAYQSSCLTSSPLFYNICQINMPRQPQQLAFVLRTHGGARPGAGRPRVAARPGIPHRPRAPHDPHHPVHVTLRAAPLPVSLRSTRVFPAVRGALVRASRASFRVIAFSVQADHLHLVVEADARRRLATGVQGLAIRVAKAVNRALGRRGTVWAERYHARALTTPRAVRHAFVYVLQNWRKHRPAAHGLDPCSSAAWFAGWRNVPRHPAAPWSPVAMARTWLARFGWRRHGLLDEREAPRRS
jgi:REP-associated tyrosine transposase